MTLNRKIIKFEVDGPRVVYYDDIWKNGVQIYPLDTQLINKLKRSGKKNLKILAALILDANSGKDIMEYRRCKGDENKISEFIKRDCKSKGLLETN